jgi:HTH-type transcriptional regulator / antitoxin HigA
MAIEIPILSEGAYREARSIITGQTARPPSALLFDLLVSGVDSSVTQLKANSEAAYVRKLESAVQQFESLKSGQIDFDLYRGPEVLIAARIGQKITQKELAERTGQPEQQIQRYERERYRNITASNWIIICRALGLTVSISQNTNPDLENRIDIPKNKVSAISEFLQKEDELFASKIEKIGSTNAINEFIKRVNRLSPNDVLFRGPINLRIGNNDARADVWSYRLRQRAQSLKTIVKQKYNPLSKEITEQIAKLTSKDDPIWSVVSFLRKCGILVVYVPPIEGSGIDGGSLVVDGVPVVGVTGRIDRMDNFWFTLFHEIAHIELHLSTDSVDCFVDSFESEKSGVANLEQKEKQADDYARGMVMPQESWMGSIISSINVDGTEIVHEFARKLGVDPSILFGRVRYERSNYSIFNAFVGNGLVRSRLAELRSEGEI